jgi:hypothetical protein
VGRIVGGIPFTRGPLAYLLRNRFYIGEVVFKGEVLPGEQPAILDRELFDAVQARLSERLNHHTVVRAKSESLLIGRLYDDRGNCMSPSHAKKLGIRYRYYVSSPLLHGQAGHAGSVCRVPAANVLGYKVFLDQYVLTAGGSTERPALQRLLADVRAGKVNVIVVHKVDRLTRSLACAFQRSRSLVPTHRDQAFRSIASSGARVREGMGRELKETIRSVSQAADACVVRRFPSADCGWLVPGSGGPPDDPRSVAYPGDSVQFVSKAARPPPCSGFQARFLKWTRQRRDPS